MICVATDSVSVITRMDATHLMTSFSWAGMRRLELAVSSPVTSVTTELFTTEEGGACDTVDNQHLPNIHFGFGLCLKSTAMVILFIKIKRSFSNALQMQYRTYNIV